ncbi:serine/threonine-protein kinase MARK2 isoform X6 [Aricia agestis]|uniref:serine/threonine-protein kinase MARK2 isoform X6 n=1 Tax=Aricia agestis TaxID=91739 RepID=UPI001C203975|nr:serine/threonine-protein kinase MARK2 isoform X6 [Aricia agestis]
MVVGENKRSTNIMDGIENTGDVRLHDHRLRLKQRFDIVRKLGQGTYGKVQLGINKKTGQEVAIKTIKKCKIETEADLVRIRREVQIMSSVRHPNIVHIYEVFENSEKMILVMEYCSGGELYDYLSQKKVLEEEEARRLFRQIATAVYYCHIHKICHRDLKLENVLLDDTGSAKIADFGLSNVFKETSLLSTFCGSPLYASPEIVKGTPYIGPEVDCWSLGVLLYTLVYGAMPFDGSNFKRLVRQISNGDYYEPKNPSTASPLIRDMLTVDPLKRADIAYICDHPWVNGGCETSCLEVAEALAAETPVRLDLLLSLAPAAPSHSNSVLVPDQNELGPEESCTDLTSSASMPVEPSNSAEKRILELVAEGGEDAIKPSPTRTLVAAGDYKRKLDAAVSNSGLVRKKERVASSVSVPPLSPALPEEDAKLDSPPTDEYQETEPPLTLKSSATITIAPTPEPAPEPPKEPEPKVEPKEEKPKETPRPKLVIKKKTSPTKSEEKSPEKLESPKIDESKTNSVSSTAEKLTSLSLAQPAATTPTKPKKLSIGGHVGSFKEQFERRASLTTSPEIKRNISKPVVSKIAKPKAQSEDRELRARSPEYGAVRLQQIGIEPSPTPPEENNRRMDGGVKKTESEPSNSSTTVDPSVLLQDARRSLQNSMAKLVEERAGEDSRRRAARDIISSAIRTGKPPVPYGRSSSAGVATASLQSPPPATTPAAPAPAPRVFRTEAHHKVEDHRNRGVSVERIIPIHLAGEEPTTPKTTPTSPPKFTPAATPPPPAAAATVTAARQSQTPIRRLTSNESSAGDASPGEPIKKSAREFIIPIAVEGKGYVTPRQRSLEPEHAPHSPLATSRLARKPRRISSLVSGGESEEEEESPMHRLRSARSRPARADSVSSGEDDEEDEGFHLLTAENLFSTLLHRVRALTNRLNGEEGPGFQHPHSLFNNLQSPFFNSAHLPRRNLFTHSSRETTRSISETREGWGSRDMGAPFDSMFKSRQQMPRDPLAHLKAKATVQNALKKLTEKR